MAESPNRRGVILFGGQNSDENYEHSFQERILELRTGATIWTILDITLEIRRIKHVVIPLQ